MVTGNPVLSSCHIDLKNRHHRLITWMSSYCERRTRNTKYTPALLQSAHRKQTLTCSPGWFAAPADCVSGQQTDRYRQIVKQATQNLLALLN